MSAGVLGGRTPSSWPSMKTRFRMGGASSFALAALAVCNGAQKGERSLAVTVSDRAANDPTGNRIINVGGDPDNWLSHGRGYDQSRNSPLTQINTRNVGQLGLKGASIPSVRPEPAVTSLRRIYAPLI